ncbi:RNase adapter RapZ [Sneathiella marina]|uniref:RNase adapter RapZ n=1 Tax=Sneathiella marina TaxID=2950108 RepID=A0ABY4W605_9PROT|nr:RNase adapter RapZ [Sneathiella marina]USG61337.1 RNase adapter RapZ [Sneathiella marina]
MNKLEVTEVSKNKIVLISGMSGAGKSSTLRQFEDMGWEIADNVPLPLLLSMVDQFGKAGDLNLALGVDFRTHGFSTKELLDQISELRNRKQLVSLLYLDCDDAILQQRFTETRRRHPLAADRPVADGIRQEKFQLSELKAAADLRVDTTNLSLPELKRILKGHFGLQKKSGLSVSIMSFSYKFGLPREADLVFDVRFLSNPFYTPELRLKSGRDPEVVEFIENDTVFDGFLKQTTDLLSLLLPRYAEEGKFYLTIAIGCTGGRHRSVCVAEKIHGLVEKNGYVANLVHRDLKKMSGE